MSSKPAWLTVDGVAERLGTPLAAVYEETTAGRLPAQQYGCSYLVRRVDVEEYLAHRRRLTGELVPATRADTNSVRGT